MTASDFFAAVVGILFVSYFVFGLAFTICHGLYIEYLHAKLGDSRPVIFGRLWRYNWKRRVWQSRRAK